MTPNTPAAHSTSGSRPFDTDVLILGTGPVGLTLANLLGGYGIRTAIAQDAARVIAALADALHLTDSAPAPALSAS